ncbi:MAG: hypothetical protein ABIJ21_04715 [Nanoarchaeota archaeon]
MKIEVTYNGCSPYAPDIAHIGIKVCDKPYVARTFGKEDYVPKMSLFYLEDILVLDRETAERHFTFVEEKQDVLDHHLSL